MFIFLKFIQKSVANFAPLYSRHKQDMYDFDEIIDRRGTRCDKVDSLKDMFGRSDLIPMWVADMDFRTPDFIIDALRRRLDHPVLGYPLTGSDYFRIVSDWVYSLHGWRVDPSAFRFIPGIVKGLILAEHCLLQRGDRVIIQPPVYHPFRLNTMAAGFEVVENPLLPVYGADGFLQSYRMDLDSLEKLIDDRTRLLILCNPHNPGGVCFKREDLARLASICRSRGVTVLSDEIHSEMVFPGNGYHPFASVSEDAAQCSISFMAPSKTFNIAGVVSSYCVAFNPELRQKFYSYIESAEIDYPSIFSAEATRAAYTPEGMRWREEMLDYVWGNIRFVEEFLAREIPQIHPVRPQASFLVWLDCRRLGLDQKSLVDLFVNGAHLALNDGTMFGKQGEGYMRLNVGCPRSIVATALGNLKKAVERLK